ncbi:MAG: hypothetical protein GWP17_06165 [Aquificales bacterium]|nr:hypothetical protein [Aquificales bacterium]
MSDFASNIPSDGGDSKEVKWEIVARTFGYTQASIIVGRLRANDIPAMAWQEGAGQAAGIIVGSLGTGYVQVPEKFTDEALALLEDTDPLGEDWEEE